MLSNIIAAAALILSMLTFGLAQRTARAADRRSRIPVLVFVYDPSGRWLLRNVGNGPALNITVAMKVNHEDHDWKNPTRIPPISRDREFQLTWLHDYDVAVLAASYDDFLSADNSGKSREYTVQMAYDLNRVVPRRELPRWELTDTLAHWQRESGQ